MVCFFLMLPIAAAIAVAVMVTMGLPVLFRQPRPGLQGRIFVLNKFRTMSDRRDDQGVLLDDASRLTPLGRFLRRTSLDEIPQLWNVIVGDMSLVGPRPLLIKYLPLYSDVQRRRHEVRPGITGWAQVNGRNATTWDERFHFDVWYVDHQSFRLDLRILALTVARVFSGTGHAMMPEFTGNQVAPAVLPPVSNAFTAADRLQAPGRRAGA
jgi:lipopolysaccharide/colanic/teichoic acid biosynthesis glycosyltransferase